MKTTRAINKNDKVKSHLISIKNQMEVISNKSLTKLIKHSGIPKPQSVLLHEIFAAAKFTNSKIRHYSVCWMILCILFQIRLDKIIFIIKIIIFYFKNNTKIFYRSPSGYKFLRNQCSLPPPCVKTIRRHLLAIKSEFVFDNEFFNLLKKKFFNKTQNQKMGVLLLDKKFYALTLV